MKKCVYIKILSISLLLFTGCFDDFNRDKIVKKELLKGEANESYHKKADSFFDEGNYAEALKYELEQLKEDLKYYREDSAEIAVDYNYIALNYKKLKDYNRSITYYEKAIKIDNKVLDLTNPQKSIDYYNIASTYDAMRLYDKALDYYLKSLTIKPNQKDRLETYRDIGKIYKEKRDYRNSLIYYKNAFFLYKKLEPKDKALGVDILENIQEINKILK